MENREYSCSKSAVHFMSVAVVLFLAGVWAACDLIDGGENLAEGPHPLTGTYDLEQVYGWRSPEWIQLPFFTGGSSLGEIWLVCAKMVVSEDGQVYAGFKEVGVNWDDEGPRPQPPGCDMPPDWTMGARYYGAFEPDDSLAIDQQIGREGIPHAVRVSDDGHVLDVLDAPHWGTIWRFVKRLGAPD